MTLESAESAEAGRPSLSRIPLPPQGPRQARLGNLLPPNFSVSVLGEKIRIHPVSKSSRARSALPLADFGFRTRLKFLYDIATTSAFTSSKRCVPSGSMRLRYDCRGTTMDPISSSFNPWRWVSSRAMSTWYTLILRWSGAPDSPDLRMRSVMASHSFCAASCLDLIAVKITDRCRVR